MMLEWMGAGIEKKKKREIKNSWTHTVVWRFQDREWRWKRV